jgi:hypothetical protein
MSRTVNKYAFLLNQVRSVKHSFNSCLPQDVVLKYAQCCTSMAVDRRFCTVSKDQKDNNTNPGSQRLALLMSMLPIIQRHQMLSLNKVLFMQDRTTRRGTTVVSRVTTSGVRNRHSEVHTNTKSNQGTIHTKGPFARGAENFMQERQGNDITIRRRLF